MRRTARKLSRLFCGEEFLLKNKTLKRWLAFDVNNNNIRDYCLPIAIEYEKNSVIGSLLFYSGTFEEQQVQFIARILKKHDHPIVLDIGANIGWHSIWWALSSPRSSIYAFEPSMTTAKLLIKNIAHNNVASQVTHVASAVADRVGIAEFNECEDSAYSSLRDTQRKRVISTITVPVTTIDRFVEQAKLPEVSLLKIDVEGLETEVVRGARSTLESFEPNVLMEIFGGVASNPDPESTIKFMQALGYKAYVWKHGAVVPFEKHSDEHFNYFFSKRDIGVYGET